MKIAITATTRNGQGTGASRRLRHANKVPGIIYGGGANTTATAIELDHNDIFHKLRHEEFHASILDMTLDGKAQQVLLRDVQMHAWKQIVLHVDFQRVSADQKIHMKVPLHFINADICPGVKISSGIVSHVLNELNISCLPKDLPKFIEVDHAVVTRSSRRLLSHALPWLKKWQRLLCPPLMCPLRTRRRRRRRRKTTKAEKTKNNFALLSRFILGMPVALFGWRAFFIKTRKSYCSELNRQLTTHLHPETRT